MAAAERASRSLVIGGSGLLGAGFGYLAREGRDVVLTYNRHHHPSGHGGSSVFLDIQAPEQVRRLIEDVKPACVIHAAAMTDVDACEADPVAAREINADAAGRAAAAAKACDVRFVYVSTDSVFDGSVGRYKEDDVPNPVNEYAASKLAGEQIVLAEHPDAVVVRTNMFGWGPPHRRSYSDWLLAKMRSGNSFPVFSDVHFNALTVCTIADLLLDIAATDLHGVLHIGNSTPCSKVEFAFALAEVFRLAVSGQVRPVRVSDLDLNARRPLNTTLDCTRAEAFLQRRMPSLREELIRLDETSIEHAFPGGRSETN